MKILYNSCSPLNRNSYGRCTAEVAYRLLEKHDVDIFAWFGLQQTELTYPLGRDQGKEERPVRIVGNPAANTTDWHGLIEQEAHKYDVIIAHWDMWAQWQRVQRLDNPPVIWWTVGDHAPVPAPHRMLFGADVFVKGIPMSKWFQRELRKCPQIDNSKIGPVIGHGVNPDEFFPSENPQVNVPEGCDFFIISVADNKGDRENLAGMIEGYSMFLKETGANAYLYVHAFPQTSYNLYNVCQMCEELYGVRLRNHIGFKPQLIMPDSFMRDLYTKADVQLMVLHNGSFELPIIEAGACGTATITTDNTPMAELVGGGERGLLVPPVAPIWMNLTSSRQWAVNPQDIANALITYYENPQLRQEHAQKMREWVLNNATWDIVGQKWLDFLDDFERERKPPRPQVIDGIPTQEHLIQKLDWDYLIILDACRYDYFSDEIGNFMDGNGLMKVGSPGRDTIEWIKNTFPDYYDMTYVSALPCINSLNMTPSEMTGVWHGEGYIASKHFKKVIDAWKVCWNEEWQAVLPEDLVKLALSNRDESKMIIHFGQPHVPYIGEFRVTGEEPVSGETYRKQHRELKIAEAVTKGKIDLDEIKRAYRDNTRRVLPEVASLVNQLDGKIVITADHGEMLGENKALFHPRDNEHYPQQAEVPWLEIRK